MSGTRRKKKPAAPSSNHEESENTSSQKSHENVNGEMHDDDDEEMEEDDEDMEENGDEEQKSNASSSPKVNGNKKANSNSPPDQMMVPTTSVRIDQSKLNQIQNDLVKHTEGFCVEKLERVFSTLMELVSSYKNKWDRTELPAEMQEVIEGIRSDSVVATSRNSRRGH